MSYNFKKLTDVETISIVPEDAELFCIIDDEIKKVNKNDLGINGNGGSDGGNIVLKLPLDMSEYESVEDYIEKTGIVGFYADSNTDEEGNVTDNYSLFVLKDEYMDEVLDVYKNGGNICININGNVAPISFAMFGKYFPFETHMESIDDKEYYFLSIEDLYKEPNPVSFFDFLNVIGMGDTIPEEEVEFANSTFIEMYVMRRGNQALEIIPQSLADAWEVDYGLGV